MTGEVSFQAANAKSAANLKVKGMRCLSDTLLLFSLQDFEALSWPGVMNGSIIWPYPPHPLFAELPLIFITPLSDVKVFEKDEAKFECEVSREPKTFRWLKGTQEIMGDDKVELIKDGTKHSLVIKAAAFEDEGKYMFEAEDKHTSAKLIIEGKYSLWKRPHFKYIFFCFYFYNSSWRVGINEVFFSG